MKYISLDIAKKVGFLALDFTNETHFNECYSVQVAGTTIYRNFDHKDLLCGIVLTQQRNMSGEKEGVHINVMLNGDVFARNFPYYDGEIELIPIYNQRKIFELIEQA